MTTDNQDTLVILKPHIILQIISVCIEIFWISTILLSLQPFFLKFNSKVSFETHIHRNVRQGVYHVLELAKQHNISVKTDGFFSPSYENWKEWARN